VWCEPPPWTGKGGMGADGRNAVGKALKPYAGVSVNPVRWVAPANTGRSVCNGCGRLALGSAFNGQSQRWPLGKGATAHGLQLLHRSSSCSLITLTLICRGHMLYGW